MEQTTQTEHNVIADVHLPTKGGKPPFFNSRGKERKNEYMKEYLQRPEVKERKREYDREYSQRPEVKERRRRYKQRPEVKQRINEYQRRYRQRPEVKEKIRLYFQRPEMKKKNKRWVQEWKDKTDYNKLLRESRWFAKERLGISYERRYLITNCIICGQDISMYHPNSKLCCHCVEKHLHELGTIGFGSHMRRRYDYTIGKVIPDYDAERKAIDSHMRECGLK